MKPRGTFHTRISTKRGQRTIAIERRTLAVPPTKCAAALAMEPVEREETVALLPLAREVAATLNRKTEFPSEWWR